LIDSLLPSHDGFDRALLDVGERASEVEGDRIAVGAVVVLCGAEAVEAVEPRHVQRVRVDEPRVEGRRRASVHRARL